MELKSSPRTNSNRKNLCGFPALACRQMIHQYLHLTVILQSSRTPLQHHFIKLKTQFPQSKNNKNTSSWQKTVAATRVSFRFLNPDLIQLELVSFGQFVEEFPTRIRSPRRGTVALVVPISMVSDGIFFAPRGGERRIAPISGVWDGNCSILQCGTVRFFSSFSRVGYC